MAPLPDKNTIAQPLKSILKKRNQEMVDLEELSKLFLTTSPPRQGWVRRWQGKLVCFQVTLSPGGTQLLSGLTGHRLDPQRTQPGMVQGRQGVAGQLAACPSSLATQAPVSGHEQQTGWPECLTYRVPRAPAAPQLWPAGPQAQ